MTPLSVNVENAESGQIEKVGLQTGTFSTFDEPRGGLEHFTLYVKDQFSLSDSAYRELSQLTPSLPRLFRRH
jgi:hypothetical protein